MCDYIPVIVAAIALAGIIYIQRYETRRKYIDFRLGEKYSVLVNLYNWIGICWNDITPLVWVPEFGDFFWESREPDNIEGSLKKAIDDFNQLQGTYIRALIYLDDDTRAAVINIMRNLYGSIQYLDLEYGTGEKLRKDATVKEIDELGERTESYRKYYNALGDSYVDSVRSLKMYLDKDYKDFKKGI